MRQFEVHRTEDVSGISGTGLIAEGVEFHDKQCCISWFGQHHMLEVAPNIETWLAVHGHEGKTKVQFHSCIWPDCYC